MSSRGNTSFLYIVIAIPVFVAIAGGIALSVAAILENVRFLKGTAQIFSLVDTVRTVTAAQKSFASTPGEDIWAGLTSLKQINASLTHPNPWGEEISATVVTSNSMRIESLVPRQECQRMSAYFLSHRTDVSGLWGVEAVPQGGAVWKAVYSTDDHVPVSSAEQACGKAPKSYLAFVFRTK